MRVCLLYDCLFPHTVGGAERWYRNLAELLAAEGHEVTYVTLRQWERGSDPGMPGITVRVVGPRMGLYTASGRRGILPPLVFGLGVLWHLLRHGRRYDVVHTASFPYFSLLSAAAVRRLGGYRLLVDWHEVWSRSYWREYLGPGAGEIGWLIQRACVLLHQRAFCFSRLYAARLQEEGLRGEVTVLPGEYEGLLVPRLVQDAERLAVFAGRHIPEKQVLSIPPAVAWARAELPELRARILGDGPDRRALTERVAEQGLDGIVEVLGFVGTDVVEESMARALCLLLPSRREGYGLVVIEAATYGTPSVVVAGPDNAAVELIEEGVNGFVAQSASPEDLGGAIVAVARAGRALRESTADWFADNAQRLSLRTSLQLVLEAYGHLTPS
jgi:glycosyltransferase involved in cell wall biosynthesis